MRNKATLIITIIIILATALLWAIAPQPVAMKRESGPVLSPDLVIMPGDLHQALDWSLAYGDGRAINWDKLGWEV